MQTCSRRSSGSLPSARIQTRAGSSEAPANSSDHGGGLTKRMSSGRGPWVSHRAPADEASASSPGSVSGAGTPTGAGCVCCNPVCGSWNDADREKIGTPCWIASTRRVVNERPSRTRSVS